MTSQSIRFPVLSTVLWPVSSDQYWMRQIVLAITGVALLTLSAKINIPFYPVPMTMQTFMVLVIGMTYGSRLGAATVVSYLVAGAIGLPVFAGTPEKGIGLVYLMGPTGGYLLGFALAAATTGYLAEKGWDRKITLTFLAMLAGTVIIYIPGLIWLANLVGWDKPILEWGLYPFVWGALAKIVLAMLVVPTVWKIVNRIKSR